LGITGVGTAEVKDVGVDSSEFDPNTIQPTVINGDNGEIL
jgi:hypothetical protein